MAWLQTQTLTDWLSKTLNHWWARQDSNLQPDRYERQKGVSSQSGFTEFARFRARSFWPLTVVSLAKRWRLILVFSRSRASCLPRPLSFLSVRGGNFDVHKALLKLRRHSKPERLRKKSRAVSR